jgi:hypothetical protein
MLMHKCVGLLVFVALPLWAQVESADTTAQGQTDSSQMLVPPPVSIAGYSIQTVSETKSNYLRGGLDVSAAYIDNLYADSTAGTISETIFTFRPTISFDQTTEREHRTFTYSPGYTLYHPTGALNETDQNATVGYSFRFAPHVTLSANESFRRSSTAYGAGDLSSGAVTGSAQPSAVGIIAPFAQEMSNLANVELIMQTGLNEMIGFSGTEGLIHFPKSTETTGLYNSDTWGAAGFYGRRFAVRHYAGVLYNYSEILASPLNVSSSIQMQSVTGYYTIYPTPSLSLSVSAGPENYKINEASQPSTSAWTPTWMASAGWQVERASFAASYARSVTGGGGLLGAYRTNGASGSFRLQMTRTWSAGLAAAYYENANVTPLLFSSTGSGHSMTENLRIDHSFNEHLHANFGYDHVHQDYAGIESIALNPNSNRETFSVSWQFMRPVGQ